MRCQGGRWGEGLRLWWAGGLGGLCDKTAMRLVVLGRQIGPFQRPRCPSPMQSLALDSRGATSPVAESGSLPESLVASVGPQTGPPPGLLHRCAPTPRPAPSVLQIRRTREIAATRWAAAAVSSEPESAAVCALALLCHTSSWSAHVDRKYLFLQAAAARHRLVSAAAAATARRRRCPAA